MPKNVSKFGQRADKVRVRLSTDTEEQHKTVEIDRYTMMCPECEFQYGYYDEKGAVICQKCGIVIRGSEKLAMKEQAGDGSRGISNPEDAMYDNGKYDV